MPRVTVIIPAYKAERTLEKAVFSVIEQTEASLEILIINDCSPDTTGLVADKLAKKDCRIRVIHLTENIGKPAGLNLATQEAKGKWVALLDADDWYKKDRITKLVNAAEANNVEMAADNQVLYDLKANCEAGSAFTQQDKEKTIGLKEFLDCSDATENFNYGMLKPVFRKDFLSKQKIEYCPFARLGEDYYILLEFFARGGRAVLLNEPLYCYVQPFGSISKKWAQDDRGNYDFPLLYRVHQFYQTNLQKCLTEEAKKKLKQRGKGIEAIIAFHDLRVSIKHKNLAKILNVLASAPLKLWQMMAKRVWAKLRR